MPFHLYKARNEGEAPQWFGVHVEFNEDHWVSTCEPVDREGNEIPGAELIAPKLHGITAGQAHRRMVDVLAGKYDEVIPAVEETL